MRVIQISDTHLSVSRPEFHENFLAVVKFINRKKPDIVIHSGDITWDAPVSREELHFALNQFSLIKCRMLLIPGNHDVGDNVTYNSMSEKLVINKRFLSNYRQVFGQDYWMREFKGWRFIGINSSLLGSGLPEEKIQWKLLKSWLEEHEQIAVFIHKPIVFEEFSNSNVADLHLIPEKTRTPLLEILQNCDGLRLVSCGHTHQTRAHRLAGALSVWAPSTAFILPDAIHRKLGEKVCGLIDFEFGEDGDINWKAVEPEGIKIIDVTKV